MRLKQLLTLLFFTSLATTANAQLLIEPHEQVRSGSTSLSAVLSFNEVEYEVDNAGSGDVERTIIGLTGAYGIHSYLDAYGELGYIAKAEISGGDDDNGFIFGGGLRGVLHEADRFTFLGRGGARYIIEEYGNDVEGDILEIDVGLTGKYAINQTISAYAGVEIFPYSDGELDAGGTFDMERDDLVGFRLGADFMIDSYSINTEVGLSGEQGFTIRVGIPL